MSFLGVGEGINGFAGFSRQYSGAAIPLTASQRKVAVVDVQNPDGNGGTFIVGGSDVAFAETPGTGNGLVLPPGSSKSFYCVDMSQIYAVGTVSGEYISGTFQAIQV